jgi:hypothetical protein
MRLFTSFQIIGVAWALCLNLQNLPRCKPTADGLPQKYLGWVKLWPILA